MKATETKKVKVVSTKHPFENLRDGDERLAKAQLAYKITKLIEERGLKQKEAADLLNITQPEVSNLNNGRLSGFTFDRLYRCLIALEVDVEIILKKHSSHNNFPAGIHVCAE